MLPIVKRRIGCQQFANQNKDDQTLNESSLTKLVGAADMYNLDVSHMTVLFYLIHGPWRVMFHLWRFHSLCFCIHWRVFIWIFQEMEPPHTLTCDLRPYQKQALFWMSELEKGIDVEKAAQTLHPCWAAYSVCDEYASFSKKRSNSLIHVWHEMKWIVFQFVGERPQSMWTFSLGSRLQNFQLQHRWQEEEWV